MTTLLRLLMIGAACLTASPAGALSIRELAQYERPALLGHINGAVDGVAAGFKLTGNRQALECVHLWAAAPASGKGDSKALTDILTLFADELGRLTPSRKPPEFEDILATAVRRQCGSALPSAG